MKKQLATKGVENTATITAPVPDKEIARIVAYPDEVFITLAGTDDTYTPAAARDIAQKIIETAALAERIDWEDRDDVANMNLVERA